MVADISRGYAFHEESSGFVSETPDRVFAMLDDHARLAAHMAKPSWRMGWATMQIITDRKRPRGVGSHIALRGRVLGLRLSVDEAVTRYEPPTLKEWETTDEPRLLVIGHYRMSFRTNSERDGTTLHVTIDYNHPASGFPRLLGTLFGRMYARWCTSQMVSDAIHAGTGAPAGATSVASARSFHSA
jgi:hypothetical protein